MMLDPRWWRQPHGQPGRRRVRPDRVCEAGPICLRHGYRRSRCYGGVWCRSTTAHHHTSRAPLAASHSKGTTWSTLRSEPRPSVSGTGDDLRVLNCSICCRVSPRVRRRSGCWTWRPPGAASRVEWVPECRRDGRGPLCTWTPFVWGCTTPDTRRAGPADSAHHLTFAGSTTLGALGCTRDEPGTPAWICLWDYACPPRRYPYPSGHGRALEP